jgi:hypothetical protein
MAFTTDWQYDYQYDHDGLLRSSRRQRILGGAALACVALACAWTLCVNIAGPSANVAGIENDIAGAANDMAGTRGDKLVTVRPKSQLASRRYDPLFDPRLLGFGSGTFVNNAALEPSGQQTPPVTNRTALQITRTMPQTPANDVAQSAPSPAPRSLALRSAETRKALRDGARDNRIAAKAPDEPTIFEKLFGKPSPLTLAYASPDDAGLGAGQSYTPGRYDRSTAVYDISAHVVYMPDGSQLEAHSGLGSMLDDPRHAAERNRGVTPPDVYELKPREGLFHGVRALRLIPVDDSKVFGRTGLLAHSFMMGPNGDSNGCVSFKNYDAFLQAYLNHEISRLVVVARQD